MGLGLGLGFGLGLLAATLTLTLTLTLTPTLTLTLTLTQVVGLLALNQGCNLLGVMLGPAINLAMLPLDLPLLGIPGLYLNPRTAAGWLAALVYACLH